IPEGADLSLTLPVAARADSDPQWHEPISRTRDGLPAAMPAAWNARAEATGSFIMLQFTPGAAAEPGRVYFFAEREGRIEPSAPQQVTRSDGRIELKLPVAHDLADG